MHTAFPNGYAQYENLLLIVHSGNCYVRAWCIDAPIFNGTEAEFHVQHPVLHRLFRKHWAR